MVVEFEAQTSIGADLTVVFDLARDIDAHKQSMSHSNETAVAGVTSGLIGLGESVTWRARHFGLPFRMTSKITEMDSPHRFVDEQTSGPFARFHHEHRFEKTEGGCLMTDQVRFEAPLGPLGRLVERAILGRYMRQLIIDRGAELREMAEG